MFPVEMFTFEAAEGCGRGGGEEILTPPAPADSWLSFHRMVVGTSLYVIVLSLMMWKRRSTCLTNFAIDAGDNSEKEALGQHSSVL